MAISSEIAESRESPIFPPVDPDFGDADTAHGAAAASVALWAASDDAPRWLRVVLPALAVLAIAPHLEAHRWDHSPNVPAFYAAGGMCLIAAGLVLLIGRKKNETMVAATA